MNLTENEIKQIDKVATELKKSAVNQSYIPPSVTKVQLAPSWRYKKAILLLCAKTNVGAKVEKDFDELDVLHQEYESWRAKTLTEDNEGKFLTLVDCLKGTLYNLAGTFQQIAYIFREESSSEMPAETEQNIGPAKRRTTWNRVTGFFRELYGLTIERITKAWLDKYG